MILEGIFHASDGGKKVNICYLTNACWSRSLRVQMKGTGHSSVYSEATFTERIGVLARRGDFGHWLLGQGKSAAQSLSLLPVLWAPVSISWVQLIIAKSWILNTGFLSTWLQGSR